MGIENEVTKEVRVESIKIHYDVLPKYYKNIDSNDMVKYNVESYTLSIER